MKPNLFFKMYFVNMLLTVFYHQAGAQFATAVGTENAAGVSVLSRNTGNDVLDLSGNTYRVSVWDDDVNFANHGLSWEVDYGGNFYSGTIGLTFANDVIDPDVVLMHDATGVFAFIVYHVTGSTNKYYWEAFKWTNTGGWGFSSAFSATLFQTANFGITLNVDADSQGNFSIVWDDNNLRIYVLTGNISTGTFLFNNSGNPVLIKSGGIKPDICMFYNNTNKYAYVCYIDNSGDINVDRHNGSTLASGSASSLSNQLNASPTSGYFFTSPRIACPNQNGNPNDWTVVFVETDYTDYFIEGFNNNNGTVSTLIVYNDGSGNSPADISLVQNGLPVVTYDDQSPYNIWVGWTFANISGYYSASSPFFYTNVVDAIYPLVLKCDDYGVAVSGTDYWQVPTALTSGNNDDVNILSLAGRFATNRLYLTYNEVVINASNVKDIFTKEATPTTATSLRVIRNDILTSETQNLNKQKSGNKNFLSLDDKTYGGNEAELHVNILNTTDNKLILAGSSLTNINGDKTDPLCDSLNSDQDLWLVKIDTSFNILWDKSIGGSRNEQHPIIINTGNNHEMLLSCISVSDSSCEKSENDLNPLGQNSDYWICKIDSNGNKIWDKTFGGDEVENSPNTIQLTSGNFLSIGTSGSPVSGDKTVANYGLYDYWAIKYDNAGNKIWDNVYGGTHHEVNNTTYNRSGKSVLACPNDGFILAGTTFSDAGGSISEPAFGQTDIWVVKGDSLGNIIWDKRFGGNSGDGASDIINTIDSGYLIVGGTSSTQGGNITDTILRGLADGWIIKLDSSGNKQWDKRYGGNKVDNLISVMQCADGGYLISAETNSDSSYNVSEPSYGGYDYWFFKIDSVGNMLWDKRLGGPGDDRVSNFVVMHDSSVFLFGFADTGITATKTDFGKANMDYWLVHFKYDPQLTALNEQTLQNNYFTVAPNPVSDFFELQFSTPLKQNFDLRLFDITGRLVHTQTLKQNTRISSVDITAFSKGVYFVMVNTTAIRIVKQ